MKVSVGKEEGNRLGFTLDGVSPEFANALRRYSMMSVPTFAVTSVVFYDNTASIFDEYLAHRVGLIPLLSPAKASKDAEVVFVVDEAGPKVVYSSDMKSSDKDVKPAREKVPIVTLAEGQKLRFEAKAHVGIGREHARHQAGLVSYGIDGDKFTFKVESFYQMEPSDVIVRACDVMLGEISEIQKALKKKK